MKLIFFHAKRRWSVAFVIPAILFFLLIFQKTELLFSAVGAVEIVIALIIGLVSCFTISNPAEMELCKYCGFAPSRIMTAQILPAYIAGAVSSGLTMFFFDFSLQEVSLQNRILLAVSAVISLTFMVSTNAVLRVLARNTYIVVFLNMVVLFLPMYTYHDQMRFLKEFRPRVLFDIALSGIVFDSRFFHVDMLWWIVNRVGYLALAIIFYVAACRLADRRSFEDFK